MLLFSVVFPHSGYVMLIIRLCWLISQCAVHRTLLYLTRLVMLSASYTVIIDVFCSVILTASLMPDLTMDVWMSCEVHQTDNKVEIEQGG